MSSTIRAIATSLAVAYLAACAPTMGPPGQPSSTNVNPETGPRGGSASSQSR